MNLSFRSFVNGIKLLALLFAIWLITGTYVLYLTWSILEYLNAVVELAQLPSLSPLG